MVKGFVLLKANDQKNYLIYSPYFVPCSSVLDQQKIERIAKKTINLKPIYPEPGACQNSHALHTFPSQKIIKNGLRTLTGGMLKTSGGSLLPKLQGEHGQQFTGGDVRARENPGLSSLHTIFVREHNRIATAIYAIRPQYYSDEQLYQVTRRYSMM